MKCNIQTETRKYCYAQACMQLKYFEIKKRKGLKEFANITTFQRTRLTEWHSSHFTHTDHDDRSHLPRSASKYSNMRTRTQFLMGYFPESYGK